jgi:hypothetical protein
MSDPDTENPWLLPMPVLAAFPADAHYAYDRRFD